MINKKLVVLFSLLIYSCSINSDELLDELLNAAKAHYLKDYSTAFTIYEKLAEQGDATAQFNLALMYDSGDGVMHDPEKAFDWYKKAAEQGVSDAQYNLGVMYTSGLYNNEHSVKYNYTQAFY